MNVLLRRSMLLAMMLPFLMLSLSSCNKRGNINSKQGQAQLSLNAPGDAKGLATFSQIKKVSVEVSGAEIKAPIVTLLAFDGASKSWKGEVKSIPTKAGGMDRNFVGNAYGDGDKLLCTNKNNPGKAKIEPGKTASVVITLMCTDGATVGGAKVEIKIGQGNSDKKTVSIDAFTMQPDNPIKEKQRVVFRASGKLTGVSTVTISMTIEGDGSKGTSKPASVTGGTWSVEIPWTAPMLVECEKEKTFKGTVKASAEGAAESVTRTLDIKVEKDCGAPTPTPPAGDKKMALKFASNLYNAKAGTAVELVVTAKFKGFKAGDKVSFLWLSQTNQGTFKTADKGEIAVTGETMEFKNSFMYDKAGTLPILFELKAGSLRTSQTAFVQLVGGETPTPPTPPAGDILRTYKMSGLSMDVYSCVDHPSVQACVTAGGEPAQPNAAQASAIVNVNYSKKSAEVMAKVCLGGKCKDLPKLIVNGFDLKQAGPGKFVVTKVDSLSKSSFPGVRKLGLDEDKTYDSLVSFQFEVKEDYNKLVGKLWISFPTHVRSRVIDAIKPAFVIATDATASK